jgi:hypothetical protein
LLVHRRIDGLDGLSMRGEHLVQNFSEILEEMQPIGNLSGGGCPLACALGIGARAIPRDPLYSWVLPQPLDQRVCSTIREEGHGLPALQIHQDRAIGLPFAQGEIVYTQHPGRGKRRGRLPAPPA